MARCRSTISLGWYPEVRTSPAEAHGLHTRCALEDVEHVEHVGNGLPEFDYQRWHWFTGDRRTYLSDRADERAWEV